MGAALPLDPVTPGRHIRRAYLLAAAGFACFTVYGSLVPFHYQERDFADAVRAFEWACRQRAGIQSRGDWLANCLLGVPAGFWVTGALRVRAQKGTADWAAAAAAVAFGALLAAAVEFAQLYFPGRTCSLSDIVAQALGSAIGAVGWLAGGRRLTQAARRTWADPRSGGAVGQLLLGYLAFVAVVQTLPLDIMTSPREVYHRLRDGPASGAITLIPTADITTETAWRKLQTGLELAGLFLPAGLIAARLPAARTWGGAEVLGGGLALAAGTELAQVLVSRHPSATDVLVGGFGVLAGFGAGGAPRRNLPLFAVVWLAMMVLTHWQPFRFAPAAAPVTWVPFADAQAQNYFGALDGILARLVMFLPVGALAVRAGGPVWAGPVAGFLLAGVLEVGQLFLPDRTAATTELVTGTLGAAAGAVAARRLSSPGGRTR